MTTKFKILSSIAFIALAIVLTFVGVWALTNVNFAISGDISYKAPVPVSPDEISYLSFSYNDTELTAEVTGFNGSVTQVKIPSLLAYNNKTYKVTGIASSGNVMFGGIFSNANITSVSLPNTLLKIGDYSFKGCTGLTSIIIPNSVTSIGIAAFSNCTNLTNLQLSENLLIIYGTETGMSGNLGAFAYCSSLTSITIPESVTNIGKFTFQGCKKLEEVNIKAVDVPTGASNMFYDCSSLSAIYVPMDSVYEYQTAEYWSDYESYIVGKDFK